MIRWTGRSGAVQTASLFGTFAALARGDVDSFPGLRPHQRDPWHAFTVQIAAMAMLNAGLKSFGESNSETDWETLLTGLTPSFPGGEPWQVVVDDWTKPALLQPPIVTAANTADYKNVFHTPDQLDLLVTSRNHDLKSARMSDAALDHWLFALVALQTGEGFLGAGNYGISRMNGGFSSRLFLRVHPSDCASDSFRRDVQELLKLNSESQIANKTCLVWTTPWDGTETIAFSVLHPLYVDTCRRIRLAFRGQDILGHTATSKCARIESKALMGVTGDPWAPIRADGTTSITASAVGFSYRQIAKLLDPKETMKPPLAQILADDPTEGLVLTATALVRGQGKTEGFHTRSIPISKAQRHRFSGSVMLLDAVGAAAVKRADEAGEVNSILRRSLIYLNQGAPEQARLDDKSATAKTEAWTKRFNAAVDGDFFGDLFWSEVNSEEAPHRVLWRTWLADQARDIFDEAARSAARTDTKRIRAHARSKTMLENGLSKNIKKALDNG